MEKAKEIKASAINHVNKKKGLFEKPLNKKQIIVTKDKLIAYKDDKDYFKNAKPLFEIILDKDSEVIDLDNYNKQKNTFGIKHFQVEEYFSFDDQKHRENWKNCIQQVIDRHNYGRSWLKEAEVRLIEEGDSKEVYRLISNHIINENATCKDTEDQTDMDKLDEAWGFEIPPKESKKDGLIFGYVPGSSILHIAVQTGQSALIKKIFDLKRKPNPDIKNGQGDSPLHTTLMMKKNRQELDNLLLTLIEVKANVDILDKENYTPCTRACQVKNWKMVDILIYSGKCNLNLQPDIATPLHYAVEHKDLATIRSILKYDIDLKIVDKNGKTATDIAVTLKDKESVALLLKKDTNINSKSVMAKHYLPILIELDYIDKTKEILEVDPSSANYEFNNPEYGIEKCSLIASAIQYERKDLIKLLLENFNIDVNATISQKMKKHNSEETEIQTLSPLHLAILKKSSELVHILINKGADCVALTEPHKLTPLMLAIKTQAPIDIIKGIMESKSVDIQALSGSDTNLLHFAAESDNIELFNELIEKGLDIQNMSKLNQTILSSACMGGRLKMAKFLIEEKSQDIRGSGSEKFITDSYPPIHCAAISGNIELMSYLLAKAKEITGEDLINFSPYENQMKPIHLAVLNGHKDLVQFLLDKGADPRQTINISGDKGVNCLHLASGYGFASIVALLLDFGMEINSQTQHQKQTPLHFALKRFQFSVVKVLGERGGASDSIATQLAIQTGNVEILEFLETLKK